MKNNFAAIRFCLVLFSLWVFLAGCNAVSTQKGVAMKVKRSEQKVWIDGVEGFSNGTYASSVHGSQARILEYLGENTNYADLVCYSGFAFRVNVHDQMCPSGGHPACGYSCMENSLRAIHRRMKLFESTPWSEPKTDREAFETEVCAAIKQSIDRGIPVQYSCEEAGLIIGYGDNGKRWWCVHPYYKNGQEAFWYDEGKGFAGGDKWPWSIVIWQEPVDESEVVSDRELTIAALNQAVDMWTAQQQQAYYVGEAAYKHWLAWLEGVEAGTIDDPQGGMLGNGWYFEILIHSRAIAGKWLAERSEFFAPQATEQLKIASEHYAKIAATCADGLEYSWNLAPYPKDFGKWTSQMRKSQISRLQVARKHDSAAIKAISKALEIIDK